ncbi:MAG: hypothetical protein L0154_29830 [Chloroflexi bacterium]|nr:hypothetical protein [Chloroflexota bacterium]
MNRKLFFLLVILVLAVSACDLGSSEEDFEAPDEPQVRLASSNSSVDGETVVTCLPQGRDNVVCELGSDNLPAQTLALTDGAQPLSVQIGDELGEPTLIEIQSRDTDASGNPTFATTIGSGESFTLGMGDGFYVLDVTARYDDVEGQGASVTTSFAVTIGQGVAIGTTPNAEDNATATTEAIIDATATAMVGDEPTETEQSGGVTPAPEEETSTPSDDEEPTLNATQMAATLIEEFAETETAAVSGVDETETPSDVEATLSEPEITATFVMGTLNATLTEGASVVEVTDTPADVVTEEPTIAPTDTIESTEEPPQQATPTFTPFQPQATDTPEEVDEATPTFTPFQPQATDTPEEVVEVTPSFTPFVPTETPVDTAVPTDIPPTATAAEATPPPPATPTPGEIELPEGAPEIEVAVSGLLYQPASVEYCEGEACEVSTFPSRRIQARPNNAVTVRVPGARPQGMRFAILNRSTFDSVFEGTRGSSNAYLFNVSVPNAGLYIIEIELTYENNIVISYLYQLQVR